MKCSLMVRHDQEIVEKVAVSTVCDAVSTGTGSAPTAHRHCQALPQETGRHSRTGSKCAQSSHTGTHSSLLVIRLQCSLCTIAVCDCTSLPLTRIVTIQICVIEATSTGVCCPLIQQLPRKWCLPKSLSSRKRRTCWSPHCWTNSSATFPRWPPSTTSHQVPLWKGKCP